MDVGYLSGAGGRLRLSEEGDIGFAAAVVFADPGDTAPLAQFTAACRVTAAYVPGQLYRRELPCLRSVLAEVARACGGEPLCRYFDLVFVDGFALLEPGRPGLGAHLRRCLAEEFGGPIPVVGVAKHYFHNCELVACAVYRGEACAGMEPWERVVPPAGVGAAAGPGEPGRRLPGNPLYVTAVGFPGEDSVGREGEEADCGATVLETPSADPTDPAAPASARDDTPPAPYSIEACVAAARLVLGMGGPYRLPSVLKCADTITRLGWRDGLPGFEGAVEKGVSAAGDRGGPSGQAV